MSGPYSEKKSGGAPHPKGTGRVSRQAEKSPAGAEKPANIVEAGDPAANSGHDEAVRGMFGRIVRFYDFLNHFLSFGIDGLIDQEIVDALLSYAEMAHPPSWNGETHG